MCRRINDTPIFIKCNVESNIRHFKLLIRGPQFKYNGKQFDNTKFKKICNTLGIKNAFSSPAHPQTNGQLEVINEIIKDNLKM